MPEPRPEAFKEDVELAKESGKDAEEVYNHIRAACESGWDFSSRWFEDGENLSTIHTTEIIPVDLNVLLFHLESTLATAYRYQGNPTLQQHYKQTADARKAAIFQYCWDESSGTFRDYDFVAGKHTEIPSLAMMYPLFFKIASMEQAEQVARYIQTHFLQAGGVVSTLNRTGEQWDSPNGWAPLQWITIQGLRNYGFNELADDIQNRWIRLNIKVYKQSGKLVEKYNVVDENIEDGGGEYPTQDGFGWTNGVLLRLLNQK